MVCLLFMLGGSWLAVTAARGSPISTTLETVAGVLIGGSLVLFGYELHRMLPTMATTY